MDFNEELTFEIKKAVKNVLADLFSNGENYYYITLVTDGLANTPTVSCWSAEALSRVCEEDRYYCKWSYTDSPYCCWKQEYFDSVKQMLLGRKAMTKLTDEEFNAEYNLRLSAMEAAMVQLDREGLFSINQDRENVVVLVEVMPPDYTNTERAHRMNSGTSKIFREWLDEAAEE